MDDGLPACHGQRASSLSFHAQTGGTRCLPSRAGRPFPSWRRGRLLAAAAFLSGWTGLEAHQVGDESERDVTGLAIAVLG